VHIQALLSHLLYRLLLLPCVPSSQSTLDAAAELRLTEPLESTPLEHLAAPIATDAKSELPPCPSVGVLSVRSENPDEPLRAVNVPQRPSVIRARASVTAAAPHAGLDQKVEETAPFSEATVTCPVNDQTLGAAAKTDSDMKQLLGVIAQLVQKQFRKLRRAPVTSTHNQRASIEPQCNFCSLVYMPLLMDALEFSVQVTIRV